MGILGRIRRKAIRMLGGYAELPEPEPVPLPLQQGARVFVPAGHHYSPSVDPDALEAASDRIWPKDPKLEDVKGIEWNEAEQVALAKSFQTFFPDFDYPDTSEDPAKYHIQNEMFGKGDGFVLFSMLRHFKPKRMIEVGSGWSSLLTADVNLRFLDGALHFTCIEPYPRDFLKNGVPGISELVIEKVEDVPLARFEDLESNDILFIDSAHVSKTGSDVNYLFFEVLPRLKPGVVIHIHDIFFPRDYPKHWVVGEARSWNEQYIVRALLMYSKGFKVLFLNNYMRRAHPDLMPEGGGSIWLQKLL